MKLFSEKNGFIGWNGTLKRHLKIHDGTKFFFPSCIQYFDSEEKLNKHKIDKHSYNHVCTFCGKIFNQRQNMNEHIKAHEINKNRSIYI